MRFRPSNLPPKSPAELREHQRQLEKLKRLFQKSEEQKALHRSYAATSPGQNSV